jgi:hypothetical protein
MQQPEMLMPQLRRAFSYCNHTRLDTNSLKLRPIEPISAPRQFFKVDVWRGSHLPRVNFEDTRTGTLAGEGELDLTVKVRAQGRGCRSCS